jgi:hypothetical protein
MRRISYSTLATVVLGAGLLCAAVAFADPRTCPGFTPTPPPSPMGAALFLREFNDCPSSTLSSLNNYPALIQVDDLNVDCIGGANLHSWNFSTDGLTTVTFENCSVYRYCADVTLNSTGAGGGEGGLKVSPWWNAPHYAVDGRFMINAGSGEIACFGGRLPFYSFTTAYGLHYVKGQTAHMEIVYDPNQLGDPAGSPPATITYRIQLPGGPLYSSPPLNFDQGNLSEGPLHGLWGELNAAGVGGYMQHGSDGTSKDFHATWRNICFYNDRPVPVNKSTWGSLKTLYR